MNIETRNKIKHSVKEKINSNHLVDEPSFEFIIRKGNHYICYIEEYTTFNEFICVFNESIDMIPTDEIIVTNGIDGEIEGCAEAYLFFKLSSGYEVIDIHKEIHQQLWSFIHEFSSIADEFEYGAKKYLTFCEQTGITYEYMNNYNSCSSNLYEKYHIINPFQQLLNQLQKGLCHEY